MKEEFFNFIINILQELYNSYNNNTSSENNVIVNIPMNNLDDDLSSDSSKTKKILKILLTIILFLIGGALEQLELLLSKERYDQISKVVLEMENRPDKLKAGIHLLNIIKLIIGDISQKKFEKIMNDLIKYFSFNLC